MNTDCPTIFIVTYHKDFLWLEYLLRSIEKYAINFRDVTIVCDTGHEIPNRILTTIKSYNLNIVYVDAPTHSPQHMKSRCGYMWQQWLKLNWWNYSDNNSCMQIDSDCIIKETLSPQDLKHEKKWVWNYRPWSCMRTTHWKPYTDKILNIDTTYESMLGETFVLTRKCTQLLLEHITGDQSQNWSWNFMNLKNIERFSEYCLYGNYIKEILISDDYYYKIWNTTQEFHNCPRKTLKYRSYDGLSNSIIQEYESYLKS
jgi:hypothetical protein